MLQTLVDAAFEYAYPLFAVAQTRYRAVQDEHHGGRHAPNTLKHERQLGDHTTRWITTPNNDTLYANAWLDLSGGPVQVQVGAMPPGRYWSVAFMDAFTNNFAMLGQRLDGSGPVSVTLAGPGHHGHQGHASADDSRVIQAPGNDVWLFARCLVDGAGGLAQSHAMQDQITVLPQGRTPPAARVVPVSSQDPENFLAVVNESLAANPPPADEAALLASWACIGIRPGSTHAWQEIGEPARQAWLERCSAVHEQLRQSGAKGRRNIQGWVASGGDIGNFGKNFSLRASVASGGLGALAPQEAMYFVMFNDAQGQPLQGRQRYILRVPASGIPTDSFWSFSMYQPTADGQRFFVDNPIQRYTIGNRTTGLRYNADGSLDIALQHSPPKDEHLRANWLPTPTGNFQIALRTYLPQQALRDGLAPMPALVQVADGQPPDPLP